MENKQYPKEYFQLVQENERLLDKPLKTKQLTFFQDAMLRFTKNRYNVIASIILLLLILLSIFVPIITDSQFYERTNSSLMTLPPRIPLIEKLGILDGTKKVKDQPINYTTIDPETGLGYPTVGFDSEFIDFSTLTNRVIVGSERSVLYVGGTNELFIAAKRIAYSIVATEMNTFFANNVIELDIDTFDYDGVLKVYISSVKPADLTDTNKILAWDDARLTYLGETSSVGITQINPLDNAAPGISGYLIFKYELPELSEAGKERISFNSIKIVNTFTESILKDYNGFSLSSFNLFSTDGALENGAFYRRNAEMIVASFKYDVYGALFGDKTVTIGAADYLSILEENPGMEETIIVNPDNPKAWVFAEDFPIIEVLNWSELTINGVLYRNYRVIIDGAYQLGFEDTPYFLFGTDVFGKDLFSLIWLGLRTSLLLGFLASIVNIIVGVIWGATSAYYGGQVDILMERFTDIWGSFPQITMISIITVLIGPGFTALFIFTVYDGWIGAANITRSQFYRYKGREYVLAARTFGASDRRIIFKHILPNALGTIITRVILSIPSIIFLEVNLSFLGFGIGNGARFSIGPVELTGSSIGVILFDGQQQIFAGNLWLIIFPTIIVSILMITFNMFGNALRDALNPQLRGSE
jgi:oligopeptide transport system permease protein